MNRAQALVIVAAELRLFLRPGRRGGPVRVTVDGPSSLGHVVQSLGVPLTEVGRLLGWAPMCGAHALMTSSGTCWTGSRRRLRPGPGARRATGACPGTAPPFDHFQ
jgi:hypothetical protein